MVDAPRHHLASEEGTSTMTAMIASAMPETTMKAG